MIRRLFLILLPVAAVSWFLLDNRSAPLMDGGLQWQQGCRMSYQLRMHNESVHGQLQQQQSDFSLSLEARLNAQVIALEPEIQLALQMENVDVKLQGGQHSEQLQQLYTLPFVITVTPSGKITEVKQAEVVESGDQEMIQQLVSYLDVDVRRGKQKGYVARHLDVSGRYLAHYQSRGEQLEKNKRYYIASEESPAASLPEIMQSSFLLTPAESGCWLSSIVGHEQTESAVAYAQSAYVARSKVELDLQQQPLKASSFWSLQSADEVLSAATRSVDAVEFSRQKARDVLLSRLLETDPDPLMTMLSRINDGKEERRLLELYLRQNPEQLNILRQHIINGELQDELVADALRLAAELGSVEAQSMLLSLWQDESLGNSLRRQALYSLTYLQQAVTDEVFNALLQPLQETDAVQSDLTAMPLLISGVLVRGAAEQDEAAGSYYNQQLQQALQAETQSWKKSLLLAALGNAQQAANVEVLSSYLEAAQPELREAAAHAAMRYTTPEMAAAVVKQLDNELSPHVSSVLLKSLEKQSLNDTQLHSIGKALIQSDNSEVRAAAIRTLTEHKLAAPDITASYIKQAYQQVDTRENIKLMFEFMAEQ